MSYNKLKISHIFICLLCRKRQRVGESRFRGRYWLHPIWSGDGSHLFKKKTSQYCLTNMEVVWKRELKLPILGKGWEGDSGRYRLGNFNRFHIWVSGSLERFGGLTKGEQQHQYKHIHWKWYWRLLGLWDSFATPRKQKIVSKPIGGCQLTRLLRPKELGQEARIRWAVHGIACRVGQSSRWEGEGGIEGACEGRWWQVQQFLNELALLIHHPL